MYIFARNQSVESSTLQVVLSRNAWALVLLDFSSDSSAYQTFQVLSGALESEAQIPPSIALPLH